MEILVVDDNQSNQNLLKLLIDEWFEDYNEDTNYQIDFADNGQIAIDMMEKKVYNLVFLDIMMPVLDGFGVLEKLDRKSFNDETKIIVCSAIINDSKNKEKSKKLKANGFLVKPISFESLNEIFKRYVSIDEVVDDFDDFDDFMDLEDTTTNTNELELINESNETHTSLSAIDFLSNYSEDDINYRDIDEHEEMINNLLFHIEENIDFNDILIEFSDIIKKILSFIFVFIEIENLVKALEGLDYFLDNIEVDINNINKDYIFKLFVAVVEDLYNWEKIVFIEKSTNNINYINASMVNSYLMIKKGLENG